MRVYGRRRRGIGRRVLLIPVAIVVVAGVAVGVNTLRLSGHVASGVSSAGVDLGGLSKARATDVLGRELNRRLDQPIRVRVNGRSAEVVPTPARHPCGRRCHRAARDAARARACGAVPVQVPRLDRPGARPARALRGAGGAAGSGDRTRRCVARAVAQRHRDRDSRSPGPRLRRRAVAARDRARLDRGGQGRPHRPPLRAGGDHDEGCRAGASARRPHALGSDHRDPHGWHRWPAAADPARAAPDDEDLQAHDRHHLRSGRGCGRC